MASRLKLLNHPAESPQTRGRHHKNVGWGKQENETRAKIALATVDSPK
jgi:hypothetical protein